MGNVLRGSIELLAENVKHSNEVEGLQYLRRVCSVLENMQTSPGKKILGIQRKSWHIQISLLFE